MGWKPSMGFGFEVVFAHSCGTHRRIAEKPQKQMLEQRNSPRETWGFPSTNSGTTGFLFQYLK
jgi:hypothetical protein